MGTAASAVHDGAKRLTVLAINRWNMYDCRRTCSVNLKDVLQHLNVRSRGVLQIDRLSYDSRDALQTWGIVT